MLFLLQFSNFRFASRETKFCKKYYSTPSSNILDPDLFGLDPDPTLYLEDTESNTSTTLRNSLNYLLVKKKNQIHVVSTNKQTCCFKNFERFVSR